MPLNVTRALTTAPGTPLTAIVDGYGVAGKGGLGPGGGSLIVIGVALENVDAGAFAEAVTNTVAATSVANEKRLTSVPIEATYSGPKRLSTLSAAAPY